VFPYRIVCMLKSNTATGKIQPTGLLPRRKPYLWEVRGCNVPTVANSCSTITCTQAACQGTHDTDKERTRTNNTYCVRTRIGFIVSFSNFKAAVCREYLVARTT